MCVYEREEREREKRVCVGVIEGEEREEE